MVRAIVLSHRQVGPCQKDRYVFLHHYSAFSPNFRWDTKQRVQTSNIHQLNGLEFSQEIL